jgi:tetratricopeptide (TPR) repeat protein
MKIFSLLALCLASHFAFAAPVDDAVANLMHQWAKVNYQTAADDQVAAYKALAEQADQVTASFPGQPGPMIWEAIILGSYAKADGGLSALGKVKKARGLLLQAEKIDANALNGSVYTTLGSLYAKVPGWPISFGDKDKAREYLEKAVRLYPNSIDAHYFYADLLADRGEYAAAVQQLKQALAAPPRPGREDADSGRRKDIEKLLENIRRNHADRLAAG